MFASCYDRDSNAVIRSDVAGRIQLPRANNPVSVFPSHGLNRTNRFSSTQNNSNFFKKSNVYKKKINKILADASNSDSVRQLFRLDMILRVRKACSIIN